MTSLLSARPLGRGAGTSRRPRSRPRSVLGLVGWLAASAAVAGLGGLAAATGVEGFYRTLDKPSWTPPDALFGPAWSVLYSLMAVAAWRVWRVEGWGGARGALLLYAIQLLLNLAWTPLFFGDGQLEAALVVILALDLAVAATIATFAKRDRTAAWLLVPYLVWILYATTLNAGIVAMN